MTTSPTTVVILVIIWLLPARLAVGRVDRHFKDLILHVLILVVKVEVASPATPHCPASQSSVLEDVGEAHGRNWSWLWSLLGPTTAIQGIQAVLSPRCRWVVLDIIFSINYDF